MEKGELTIAKNVSIQGTVVFDRLDPSTNIQACMLHD
jgi:hypothetical protein